MGKTNPNKVIQKRRTEVEMRAALEAFCTGKPQRNAPPDIDDTDIILGDCIEELLESRQMIEDVRGFVATWSAKFARR